ncbi:MAG: cation diffusion facilitator family transporter [marine benthic group bacterium]|nr:cation diffusion facilitator family transporter [Gemmatimonadota bacterium]MCL7963377.1 cation diffusion facilitator family transporter [Candidatus Carthagonibacter metallireducens]MCL7979200.1 cation diffusion facilitator family transporter [Gemmatimonadota bacterium]MCL7983916.1 cation diffusion facilitator family transporter [Gemmatimonadota bacterium]
MPEDRLQRVRRVLWFVLAANLFVVVVKLIVGLRAGSLAVLGDAAHSGVDAMNNVVGLLAVNVAAAPPDEEHPYGHGKYETLAALAVVSFLSIAGFELVSGAIGRLLGSAAPLELDPLTFVLLGGTMLVNTLVAISEARAARTLRSPVLSADARHTAADVFVTASVIAGLGLVALGWEDADAWLAIVVAVLIAKSGWEILRGTIPVLVDSRAIEASRIRRFIGPVDGVLDVTDVRSRGDLSAEAFTELTVIVDGGISVAKGHEIADEVEGKLVDAGFTGAVVHVEPAEDQTQPGSTASVATHRQ